MAPSYNPELKSGRMQLVIDHVDADPLPGTLEIATAGFGITLAAFTLDKPSFTEALGVITMNGLPKTATAVGKGKATSARIKDGSGKVVIDKLTVGMGGHVDVLLQDTDITAGQDVPLSAGKFSHPP